MAKDYAKKAKKRTSASRFDKQKTSSNISSRWTWLLAGLLIGICAAFLIYLSYGSTETVPVIIDIPEVKSAKSRYKAIPADEAEDSDFSFHNVLENKVVEAPADSTEKPKIKATKKRYIMQCGSFRKQASAENLKAQIAMNGFTAHINATNEKSGTVWYRVTLGPYSSKRTAERERHQLERNNINNCRIW